MYYGSQVSILATFYALVFRQYPFAKKSLRQMFQVLIFGAKTLYEKCTRKMLVKLTTGVAVTSLKGVFIQ